MSITKVSGMGVLPLLEPLKLLFEILKYDIFFFFFLGYSGFDLDNIGKGKGGGSCTAAAFLKVIILSKKLYIYANRIKNNILKFVYYLYRNLHLQAIGFIWI